MAPMVFSRNGNRSVLALTGASILGLAMGCEGGSPADSDSGGATETTDTGETDGDPSGASGPSSDGGTAGTTSSDTGGGDEGVGDTGGTDTGEPGDGGDAGTGSETGGTGGDETGGDETGGSDTGSVDIDPDGALFVHPDGINSNPGTQDAPMRTIQWALQEAEADPAIDTIYVAAGEYATQYEDNGAVVLVEGVSLFGGVSPDWTARDPATYASMIVDVSDISSGPAHHTVEIPADVGPETVFDGFTVLLEGPSYVGIRVFGDATLSSNRIIGENSLLDGGTLIGIFSVDADPSLIGNTVDLEASAVNLYVMGIRVDDFGGLLANNTVIVAAPSIASGLSVQNLSDGQVVHNSVWSNQYAIWLSPDTTAVIASNVFEAGFACVRKIFTGTYPSSFFSNAFRCDDLVNNLTTVQGLEQSFDSSSDNIAIEGDLFDPPDLSIGAMDACVLTRGGLEVEQVAEDIDGTPRTAPVSMGAYEWDGDCL